MKTPIQEVYEKFNSMTDAGFTAWMLNNYSDLLKREKEVIIEAAAAHCYPTYEIALDSAKQYYNETFNKEK